MPARQVEGEGDLTGLRVDETGGAEDHPAHDYFEQHYGMARGYAAESFHALADRGELREGVDPDLAALNFVALMDGLQVQWLSNRARVDLVEALRSYLRGLLAVPLD